MDGMHLPLLQSSIVDKVAVEDGVAFKDVEDDGGAVTALGTFAAKFPIKSCFLLLGCFAGTGNVVVGRFLALVVSVKSPTIFDSSLSTKATGGANIVSFVSVGMRETR